MLKNCVKKLVNYVLANNPIKTQFYIFISIL